MVAVEFLIHNLDLSLITDLQRVDKLDSSKNFKSIRNNLYLFRLHKIHKSKFINVLYIDLSWSLILNAMLRGTTTKIFYDENWIYNKDYNKYINIFNFTSLEHLSD